MAAMFMNVWKQLWNGKTPMRAFMNLALTRQALEEGTVLDLGGGKNPSYLGYLQEVARATIINIDSQHGIGWRKHIDFESDTLPFENGSIDQVLVLNVLEHIYDHRHLLMEIYRVLKAHKTTIGFVPFLIGYHADPHDYFRYTHEALERLCVEAGFSVVSVSPLGLGPFTVNLNTLASFLPGYFVAAMWPLTYLLDCAVILIRPNMAHRFPLGYLFVLTK